MITTDEWRVWLRVFTADKLERHEVKSWESMLPSERAAMVTDAFSPLVSTDYWFVRLPGKRKWHNIGATDAGRHVVNRCAFDGRIVRLGTFAEARQW